MADKSVLLGRVVGVFGIAGEIKIESWLMPREGIFKYRQWQLEDNNQVSHLYQLEGGRKQGKGLVAALQGVADRDTAQTLMGCQILVARSQLPSLAPGEYYWSDLAGLTVSNFDGDVLGRVDHLFATGANDVVVVKNDQDEILIPFDQDRYIRKIDVDGGLMLVDWQADF